MHVALVLCANMSPLLSGFDLLLGLYVFGTAVSLVAERLMTTNSPVQVTGRHDSMLDICLFIHLQWPLNNTTGCNWVALMDIDPSQTTAEAVRQMDRWCVLHLRAVCASFECTAAVEQCDLDERLQDNGVWYALSLATRYPHKMHKETHRVLIH